MLAYQQPDFCQSLPGDPDSYVLIEGGKRSGQLRYRNPSSGETYLVPNIWYNQQTPSRLAFALFQREQTVQQAAEWVRKNGLMRESDRENVTQQIARADAHIASLRTKVLQNKVPPPVPRTLAAM